MNMLSNSIGDVNPNGPLVSSTDGPPPAAVDPTAELTQTLRQIVQPDQVFEVRSLFPAEYRRFNFELIPEAADWAAFQSGLLKNVYVTLNPLQPSCDLVEGAAKDDDILSRRWLMVDFDSVRPANVSATDAEKVSNGQKAQEVRGWLSELGFPEPFVADSGNGYHLLYRIDLPRDDGGLVKRFLKALAEKFDTDKVKIDTSVSNPSRITKLYGTVARKGENQPDRPHRKSAIISIPLDLKVVPRDRLEQIAALIPTTEGQQQEVASSPNQKRRSIVTNLPREEVIRRAEAYVAKMPPAISGQGGHNKTFAVACRLIQGFGLTMEEAWPIIRAYNQRCVPPWKESELEHKLKDADDYDGVRGLMVAEFSNYREVDGDRKGRWGTEKEGLSAQTITANLFNVTDGWPKQAGGNLFVPGPNYKPTWLDDHKDLFAWIYGQFGEQRQNPVKWVEGHDKVTKSEYHPYLVQNAESYEAVEPAPHHPPISNHYYLHPEVRGGDGKALAELLARFNPATDLDRQLIKSLFLTLFWGGPGGARLAFLITCDDEDENKGRGVGKTSLAEMAGHLAGGVVAFSKEEKADSINTRLLSPDALDKRMVLFDNVKTLKFSSEVLEGMLTASTISGRKLYQGNGSRPNTLTYVITINGANLSKDLAQRCVIIKVRRPIHSGDWAAVTRDLIEQRRWEIMGDILAELRKEGMPLPRSSRWGQWEKAVLAHCDNPGDCQRLIEQRQGEVDGDQDEADLVRDEFVEDLKKQGHDPDTVVAWYPSTTAAMILYVAAGEYRSPKSATQYLKNLAIKELSHGKCAEGRGFLWRGAKAPLEAPRIVIGKRGVVH
jgi:hypothetical protein